MRASLSPWRAALAAVLSFAALHAAANPTLLRDVNTTAPRQASGLMLTPALTPFVMSILPIGGIAYFDGTDPQHGAELLVANNGGQLRMVKLEGPAAGSEIRIDARQPPRSSLAGLGDLDGDGRADLVWRMLDGTLRGWRMNGAVVLAEGTLGTLPSGARVLRMADLSGDGRADLVVQLASGALQLWTLNGLAVTSVQAMAPSPGGTLAGR